MTEDQEKIAMHQLHQACWETILEVNAVQKELWSAIYNNLSPDFNKIMLAAGEAERRVISLRKMAEEMRVQGLEIDAG